MDVAPLQPGSQVLCPHCRGWHPVFLGHTEGTPYSQAMMYWVCRGGRYYAGQRGHTSRHPTRERPTPQAARHSADATPVERDPARSVAARAEPERAETVVFKPEPAPRRR